MPMDVAGLANSVVSLAYFAITYAILAPLLRCGQVRSNRLGTATAAIFFSCAVGHAFHALGAVSGGMTGSVSGGWYVAGWDVLTATVAVYYWTLRKVYGSLMQGAALFEDLEQQQRLTELEHREALAAARAQAERERDAHASMLTSVIAHSQSLISAKDLDGRYLLANREFERAFHVTEQDLLGRTDEFLDVVSAPSRRRDDLRAQQEQFSVDEWVDALDGRRHYESVKFPLFDPDGSVYATCTISLDVTSRRRADEDMATAHDVAVAATAAKSAFLATMSHEIRTPMNAVIGMTGLLLDTDLDAQQRDFVETVRSSGDALMVVINDILDFSRIEAGELRLEQQDFDLRTCAEGSMDLLAQAAAAKGLDLVLDLDRDCPAYVVGDASRLRQVLVNLLSNAVKFTDSGDVVLAITAERGAGDEVTLRLSVRDTGIGIPAEAMDRLFHSFSQVDASTTRLYGGSGLGLAISRRLAQAMGGDLAARSEVGVGSVFTATVLARVAVGDPAGGDTGADDALLGRSVLIVDDNANNRHVLRRQLAGWGLLPTVVDGPVEALRVLRAGALFDVAVLDMHMPVMDGEHLALALRELPVGRDLPLVMLTSLGDRPLSGGDVDYVAYIPKPARLSSLRSALLRAVAEPAPAPALSPQPTATEPTTRLRVLLAEDNLVNQKVAQLMLSSIGHDVDTVANGREAVLALRTAPYDVVLMDVHMPGTDGLEATRVIRSELDPGRQPRIIALTASVLLADRQACTDAGMDDYLAKPVRQNELEAVLMRVSPAVAELGTPCFDLAVLDELLGPGLPASVREQLLSSYLGDGDAHIPELVACALAGDHPGAVRLAHSLRSSSRALGLLRLADLLDRLEVVAAQGGAMAVLGRRVEAEYGAATAAVLAVLLAAPVSEGAAR